MVPQYPFNTETANIWRRSVVPVTERAPLSNHFFSSLDSQLGPLLFVAFFRFVAMSRTDVGPIMIKRGRCQPNLV